MSEVIRILQEADAAAVLVEQARQKHEQTKIALEKAKEALEEAQDGLNQVFVRGEEAGVSRSKLKKLIEERTNALMASGLLADVGPITPKAPKAPRKKAVPQIEVDEESLPDESAPMELQ